MLPAQTLGITNIKIVEERTDQIIDHMQQNKITKSWGWDLETGRKLERKHSNQGWVSYEVRLGKMLSSLTLFSQSDLKDSLVQILKDEKIRIHQEWIRDLI